MRIMWLITEVAHETTIVPVENHKLLHKWQYYNIHPKLENKGAS